MNQQQEAKGGSEGDILGKARQGNGQARHTFGLAFSGGGIRSATFCLGFIQSLVGRGLLGKVDYLSTVSGGGYIGSWLSALIRRRSPVDGAVVTESIDHLRRYGNYLTPRFGVFSLDTLAAVAGLVRNLLLNQAVLITFFLTLLFVPTLVMYAFPGAASDGVTRWLLPLVLLFLAAVFVALGLMTIDRGQQPARQPKWLAAMAALCGLAAAYRLAGALPARGDPWSLQLPGYEPTGSPAVLVGVATVAYGLLWLLAWFVASVLAGRPARKSDKSGTDSADAPKAQVAWFIAAPLAAGAALGGLLLAYEALRDQLGDFDDPVFAATLGTPLLLTVICLAAAVHIGVGKRCFGEHMREWLARAGGLCLSFGLGWLVFFAAALYGPPLLGALKNWAIGGGLAWAGTTLAGIWLGRSDKTGGAKSKPKLEIVAQVAPYVFIVGLLVALATLAHWSLKAVVLEKPAPVAEAPRAQTVLPCSSKEFVCPVDWMQEFKEQIQKVGDERAAIARKCPPAIPAALIAALALCLFLSWRVDINLFSMHQFYRNRLTRCYLGASRQERQPNPFTDFDFGDDLRLADLAKQRPIHLINCALNLTRVERLQWQQRQSASFVFSPQTCGFQLAADDPASASFTPTSGYLEPEGPWLGTAMAASGAAANPNQGYHTAPALAFCMAFFNVRLGRWVSNPANERVRGESSPGNSLFYLLKELLADTDETADFLNVSDGGHFENLGLYELVRRRCRLIVACDAGCDPAPWTFEDLGNAVRKCRIDLDAAITIDLSPLTVRNPAKRRRFAVGRIDYGNGTTGILVYVKPMVIGDETTDIFHYHAEHPVFPQQTTGDQWFDEPQFESYRKLGEITGSAVFDGVTWNPPGADADLDQWIDAVAAGLQDRYLPPRP